MKSMQRVISVNKKRGSTSEGDAWSSEQIKESRVARLPLKEERKEARRHEGVLVTRSQTEVSERRVAPQKRRKQGKGSPRSESELRMQLNTSIIGEN